MQPPLINFIAFGLLLIAVAAPKSVYGISDPAEVASLLEIRKSVGDELNRLANWVGDDPCGTPGWTGVHCIHINGTDYIEELRLMNMNFTGTLSPHVGNLTHLDKLNFMWNKLSGPVPAEIGKLTNLSILVLDGNEFTESLPPELGNLSKLGRLQIDSNNLTGPVPSSFQGLTEVKHIHLNNNSLSGGIPKELGQLPVLLHLLLDNNNLTGELPPELSNISSMVILQLDNNNFTGSIPASYSNLTNLSKLSLRNCNLSGTIPDLSGFSLLGYLDLSQNQLSGPLPSLPSSSILLTTLDLAYNKLGGEIPIYYLRFLNLELLLLQDNFLAGNVSANLFNHNAFPNDTASLLINLQNNNLSSFVPGAYSSNVKFRLYGNPLCNDSNVDATLCSEYNDSALNFSITPVDTQAPLTCSVNTCDTARGEELVLGLLTVSDEECHCAYPLVVGYRLKSPSFAAFPSYINGLIEYVASNLNMSDYQVSISEYGWEPGPRLAMTLKLFPNRSTHEFEQDQVEVLYSVFSSWAFPQNKTFGPYELLNFTIGFPYTNILASGADSGGLASGALAGILVAAVAITAIVVAAIMFVVAKRQQKRWIRTKTGVRQHERITIAGVMSFSYEDMATATNNFESVIGKGGYGKVYRGVLADGKVVAIKRAESGSLQGSKEFFTEIELLSRLHHRNLLSLVGFCDDQAEQMLVYEYMANGSLRSHLDARSKAPLSLAARIQIALGSAKGILYLHTEANPPVFHRDIKSSNILLDEKRRAKVSDFGLSKLAALPELEGDTGGGISTVVKGTPGYLDPEYFYTHMLTDKSDVYSFGVVLLEMVTGLQPIYSGKNLVREVISAMKEGEIFKMVDPQIGTYPTECMLPLIELAISCCNDQMGPRPSMDEVVRRLLAIWQSTPMDDTTMPPSDASLETKAIYMEELLDPPSYPSTSVALTEDLLSGTVPAVHPR